MTDYSIQNFDKYDEPRLHMEALLSAHLIEFDISLRILCPLEKVGIRTLGDLTSRRRSSLAKIKQLGVLAMETLDKLLERYDLSFAEE